MRPRQLLSTLAVIAVPATLTGGCDEPRTITGPPDEQASVGTMAKPAGPALVVNTGGGVFVIDGDPVQLGITVENPAKSSYNNTFVEVRLVQGTAHRTLGRVAVACPGAAIGTLPGNASCVVPFNTAVLSDGPGAGALQADAATLETTLLQTSGKKDKLLSSVSDAVMLEAIQPPPPPPPPGDPSIARVEFEETDVAIPGVLPYTITLHNPTQTTYTGVVIQTVVRQGTTERAAGGTAISCPAFTGQLPPGDCTFDWVASISNANAGTGTLVPGGAVLEITLWHNHSALDSKTFEITLVSGG